MKKYFISFAFLAASVVSAQTIEGIGDFKIGMSVTEFLENPVINVKHMNLQRLENC
jgi:hypothetical protein